MDQLIDFQARFCSPGDFYSGLQGSQKLLNGELSLGDGNLHEHQPPDHVVQERLCGDLKHEIRLFLHPTSLEHRTNCGASNPGRGAKGAKIVGANQVLGQGLQVLYIYLWPDPPGKRLEHWVT